MARNARRSCCWAAAAIMLLVALYSAMGIVQAGSLFVGERAFLNLRFWGSILVLSLIGTVFFGCYAIRLAKAGARK
jgi:hypothetical protein